MLLFPPHEVIPMHFLCFFLYVCLCVLVELIKELFRTIWQTIKVEFENANVPDIKNQYFYYWFLRFLYMRIGVDMVKRTRKTSWVFSKILNNEAKEIQAFEILSLEVYSRYLKIVPLGESFCRPPGTF